MTFLYKDGPHNLWSVAILESAPLGLVSTFVPFLLPQTSNHYMEVHFPSVEWRPASSMASLKLPEVSPTLSTRTFITIGQLGPTEIRVRTWSSLPNAGVLVIGMNPPKGRTQKPYPPCLSELGAGHGSCKGEWWLHRSSFIEHVGRSHICFSLNSRSSSPLTVQMRKLRIQAYMNCLKAHSLTSTPFKIEFRSSPHSTLPWKHLPAPHPQRKTILQTPT